MSFISASVSLLISSLPNPIILILLIVPLLILLILFELVFIVLLLIVVLLFFGLDIFNNTYNSLILLACEINNFFI